MTDRKSLKLSVCVPTFNRAAFLRESLASILVSAEDCRDKVEVIISDNASSDDTPAVVAELQNRHPWIRYHRNATNIGEQNFYQVAQMAQGGYIWLFSDDDKMMPDAIPQVIRYIQSGYQLIVMNYSVWSRDFSFVKVPHRYASTRNRIFTDHNQLLRNLGERVTFISSPVFHKDLFFAVDQRERDSLAEYGHSYMYVVYSAAAMCQRVAYHGTPLVMCRGDNSGTSPHVWDKVFILGPAYTLQALSQKGFSRTSIYAAKNDVLLDLVLKAILYRKRESINTAGLFTRLLPHYKMQWAFWLVCVPALFVPRFVPHLATRLIKVRRQLGIKRITFKRF